MDFLKETIEDVLDVKDKLCKLNQEEEIYKIIDKSSIVKLQKNRSDF